MDSQAALAQLQQQQAQAQNPNDILANQRQQLGVNAAQDTVTGLRGAINNTTKLLKQVAPGVMGRTGNSLVTDAQANRIIQNEQAPISQTLTDQGTQYTQADEDLAKLQDQASQAAQGIYQGQQDKLSYAQNLYNTLYQKEKDAQATAQAEADRQEQIREFNAGLSAKSGGGTGNIILGNSQPSSATPGMQKRSNGGFNFQDSGGNAISAAKYAQLTGQDVASVLKYMAQNGDSYALDAYNALSKVKNDAAKANVLKNYNSLFWGI